jgi:hypothetical protein
MSSATSFREFVDSYWPSVEGGPGDAALLSLVQWLRIRALRGLLPDNFESRGQFIAYLAHDTSERRREQGPRLWAIFGNSHRREAA